MDNGLTLEKLMAAKGVLERKQKPLLQIVGVNSDYIYYIGDRDSCCKWLEREETHDLSFTRYDQVAR